MSRLASYLGRPICTNKLTAKGDRISYARILIEMDLTQPLPDTVTIEKSDGDIWNQDIEYEWRPKFCQNNAQFGLYTEECGKETQQEQIQPPKRSEKRCKRSQFRRRRNGRLNKTFQCLMPNKKNLQKMRKNIMLPPRCSCSEVTNM